MNRTFTLLLITFLTVITAVAQRAPEAAELTKLLNEFLAGASTSDVTMHDRFWAEDLIYTRSAGRRVLKSDVMRDVRSAPAPKPSDPKTVFTAEDIRIQQYGDTAIVAFQLVSTTETEYGRQVARNLNSGTFIKRDGKWQVVNWQSTRMARADEESKKALVDSENALYRSILGADTKRLGTVTDQAFVWTQSNGKQVTRQQLVTALAEGRLKYSKFDTTKVTYQIAGDTAIVRGEITRLRSAVPNDDPDKTPIISFFTMTFASQGGPWRAIALHTSQ